MTEKLRVLIAHNYYTLRGGEDVVFEEEANLLERHGHVVFRLTKDSNELKHHGLQLAASTVWNKQVAKEVYQLVRQHRIDVVHFHNIFPMLSPSVFQAAKSAGAIVVKTLHNFRLLCPKSVFFRDGKPCYDCQVSVLKWSALAHGCYRDSRRMTAVFTAVSAVHRWKQTYAKFLDALIVPSEYSRRLYDESGYPMAKLHVKPHFIEQDLGAGAGQGRFVLFAGRLSNEKGIKTLLDAAAQLPDIPFKIIGSGPEAVLLDKPPSHVEWLGQLTSNEVYEWMGQAACLVVPSDCGETFGRVIAEAFSRGTPVICSNHGGQAELVDSTVGAVFEPTRTDDLVKKLREFFTHQDRWPMYRKAARQRFLDKFTAEENYRQLLSIYREAMNPVANLEANLENSSKAREKLTDRMAKSNRTQPARK